MYEKPLLFNTQKRNDNTLFCTEDFFINDASDCKPKCSSWTMYKKSAETVLLVIVGINTIAGILTTIVIVMLSFTYFRNM